jgi:hypothetical protein
MAVISIEVQQRERLKVIASYLVEHGSKSATEGAELPQRFLENGREGEESQGVSSRCCIEDDDRVLHRFDVPGQGEQRERSNVETYFIISANPMASSTPGMANARSCIMPPIIPP